MKKRKLNYYSKLGILLIGILISFTNCDKDHLTETSNREKLLETDNPYRVEMVSIKQIPDIINFLDSKVKTAIFNKGAKSSNVVEGAIFDVDNVLKVMDSLNQSNYSFNFVFPNTPKNVFYNLIVGVTPSGVKQEPYILKYVVKESHLEGFIQSGFNLSAFSGTIALHPFKDFFNKSDINNRDCTQFDQNGDPIPCQQIIVNSGTSSVGGTTLGDAVASGITSGVYISESTGGSGGSYNCRWYVTTSGPCAEGGTAIHSPGSCGAGTGVHNIVYLVCNLSSNRTSNKVNSDCPPCNIITDGGIGINITKCPPGYNDVNGVCVPISLPCISIKNQLNNNDYKLKVEELKEKTHLKHETGYFENKEGNFLPLPLKEGGHSLDIKVGSTTKGFIHSHQNDYETGKIVNGLLEIAKPIRMFSPADVIILLTIAKRTPSSNIPLDEVYGTMISSTGNYTLKFNGNIDNIVGIKSAEDYLEIYKSYFELYSDNSEIAFLLFIKNEINIDGISLYKIEDDGKITEKTINESGIIVPKDCN